jgi:hypothetical protein
MVQAVAGLDEGGGVGQSGPGGGPLPSPTVPLSIVLPSLVPPSVATVCPPQAAVRAAAKKQVMGEVMTAA